MNYRNGLAKKIHMSPCSFWHTKQFCHIFTPVDQLLCSILHKNGPTHVQWALYCVQHYGISVCWLIAQGAVSTTLAKKKNHHRDSRREERCSTCDIMLDQARSAQGKSRGQSLIGLALRWLRLIEHDITRGTAFFSPRISMTVLCFGQGSTLYSFFEAWTWLVSMLACLRLCVTSQLSRATLIHNWRKLWLLGTLSTHVCRKSLPPTPSVVLQKNIGMTPVSLPLLTFYFLHNSPESPATQKLRYDVSALLRP